MWKRTKQKIKDNKDIRIEALEEALRDCANSLAWVYETFGKFSECPITKEDILEYYNVLDKKTIS